MHKRNNLLKRYNFQFFLTVIILFSFFHTIQAQPSIYARKIVETLASPEFHGRGYVKKGEKKAAKYIAGQFDDLNIDQINKTYFQTFYTPVNTYPSKMNMRINGMLLEPGKDFIIDPTSPGIEGVFEVVNLTNEDLLDIKKLKQIISTSKDKFLIIPPINKTSFSPEQISQIKKIHQEFKSEYNLPTAGYIFQNNKLTWSTSPIIRPKPRFELLYDSTLAPIEYVEFNIQNVFIENYKSQNVVGKISGQKHDSCIVVTAHYDHLGRMGNNTYFPGANDNASGVAMMLNLARHYSHNPPEYDMLFIAFGGEEIGLVGSRYFVENPLIDLKKIKFLINLDLSGTGDEGIQVVNGTIHQNAFNTLKTINDENQLLPAVKLRGEACNSDHCFFHQKGVPAFFIYTLGGIQAYHDIYDRAETLPLSAFDNYFNLLIRFIDRL